MKKIISEYKIELIELFCMTLIIVITLVAGNSLAYNGNGYLSNQIIDGLSFENADLKYEDGKTTFTVEVYNENKHAYKLKNISINIENYKNESTVLISEIDDYLIPEEGRLVSATIDKDITNLNSLKYVINK